MSRTLFNIIVGVLIGLSLKARKSKKYIIQRGLCDWIIHLTIEHCLLLLITAIMQKND